jgi:hypothetical protein
MGCYHQVNAAEAGMTHIRKAAVAIFCGLLMTFVAYLGLLWGMPYSASRFHHSVGFASAIVLYPGNLFGEGGRSLIGNACVWAVATFAWLLWRETAKPVSSAPTSEKSP